MPKPAIMSLPPELDKRLDHLAASMEQPKERMIEQALRDFVARAEWQMSHVREGLADAAAGLVVTQEDVEAWVESWDSGTERPRPA